MRTYTARRVGAAGRAARGRTRVAARGGTAAVRGEGDVRLEDAEGGAMGEQVIPVAGRVSRCARHCCVDVGEGWVEVFEVWRRRRCERLEVEEAGW